MRTRDGAETDAGAREVARGSRRAQRSETVGTRWDPGSLNEREQCASFKVIFHKGSFRISSSSRVEELVHSARGVARDDPGGERGPEADVARGMREAHGAAAPPAAPAGSLRLELLPGRRPAGESPAAGVGHLHVPHAVGARGRPGGDGRVHAEPLALVHLLRARDLGVGIREGFAPVRQVPRGSRHREEHGEKLGWETERSVHQPAVKVDVRVELPLDEVLVVPRRLFQLDGDVDEGIAAD